MPLETSEKTCAPSMTLIFREIITALCEVAGMAEDRLSFCLLDHELNTIFCKKCPGQSNWDNLAYQLAWTAGMVAGDTRDLTRYTYPPLKNGKETPPYKLFTVRADPYIPAGYQVRSSPFFTESAGGAAIFYDMTTPGIAGAVGVVLDGVGCHDLIARVRGDIVEGDVVTPPPYVHDSTSPLVPEQPARRLLTI